jgi:hypothetical protein
MSKYAKVLVSAHAEHKIDCPQFAGYITAFRTNFVRPNDQAREKWEWSLKLIIPHKHRMATIWEDWAGEDMTIKCAAPKADTLRKKMVDAADFALIFWNGRSAGTQKLIDMVEAKGIPFVVHLVD